MKSQNLVNKSKIQRSSGNTILIFTDDCFDSRSKIGVGCKLVLKSDEIENFKSVSWQSLPVEAENFDDTNASKLELQTLIWTLDSLVSNRDGYFILYTKSKTPFSLLERRSKLEKSNFMSARPGIHLANSELFQEFFKLHDRHGFEVVCLGGKSDVQEHDLPGLILAEVVKHADRKLKDRLKLQNQVANKWF